MVDIFVSCYQVSVDRCLIADLLSTGANVYLPDDSFKEHIDYLYRWEDLPQGYKLISHKDFITHQKRFAIIIPCVQHYEQFHKLYRDRGSKDELVFLSAQVEMKSFVPLDHFKYVMTHDTIFHRLCNAPYKILYFNRPHIAFSGVKDIRKSYENRQVQLYQNNFNEKDRPEVWAAAMEFRKVWFKRTGKIVPFFGTNSEHDCIMQNELHKCMSESMFTLSFKQIETWGQMINESMLLGTPVIFGEEFLTGTLKAYEVTPDTAFIKGKNEPISHLVDRLLHLSLEEYETLCVQAQTIAELFTAKEPRQRQVKWLFSKISE